MPLFKDGKRQAIQIIIPLTGDSYEEGLFDAVDADNDLLDAIDQEHDTLASHVSEMIGKLGEIIGGCYERGSPHGRSIFDSTRQVGVVDIDDNWMVIPKEPKKANARKRLREKR